MTVDVWIPAGTRPEHRSLLPPISAIHDLPADGRLPARLGRGQFLVAGFSVERITQVIQRLDGLQVVQTLSAGVDRLADKIPAGVVLCDASGVHDTSVSEWVVMAILASLHNLPAHVDGQRNARWLEPATEADDLEDATVLIVGYGSIGRAVERRLAPFGVKFLRVAMHSRDGVSPPTELPDLLPRADVVIVLLPLTDSTRGMVDAKFISRMRRGALLVNAARGPLVDTDALLASLLAGQIRAALDVTDPEPLPDGHPLWSAPGILITPHVGGWVRKRLDRSWRLVADRGAVRSTEVLLLSGARAEEAVRRGAIAVDGWVMSPALFERSTQRLTEWLSRFHQEHPLRPGQEIGDARTLFDRLLEFLDGSLIKVKFQVRGPQIGMGLRTRSMRVGKVSKRLQSRQIIFRVQLCAPACQAVIGFG